MILDTNQGDYSTPDSTEGGEDTGSDVVTLSKAEYEKLNQTIGSYKRELKDLKKPKETQDTPQDKDSNPESIELLQKTFLRAAGITAEDEVDEALKTAKKWGISVDKLVDDEDFQIKLEKLRTAKSNADATSNIRGDKTGTSAKETPAYWIAKGTPPTAEQVPDRATRTKIARAMIASQKSSKKFYND